MSNRMLQNGEFADVHSELLSFANALTLMKEIENAGFVREYVNGSNQGGRWIFQIYNREFMELLACIVQSSLNQTDGAQPVLEVMSGDGRLTQFLRSFVSQEIIATDLKSSRYNIAYPKWIHKMDAIQAVDHYDPALVILSWEPYLSMAGLEIAKKGRPLVWIGGDMCGHTDILGFKHQELHSEYALGRHDSFLKRHHRTAVRLFNFTR